MNIEDIDWYKFILDYYFIPKQILPPSFFTPQFVYFKLSKTINPKAAMLKTLLYQKFPFDSKHIIRLISDSSFFDFIKNDNKCIHSRKLYYSNIIIN